MSLADAKMNSRQLTQLCQARVLVYQLGLCMHIRTAANAFGRVAVWAFFFLGSLLTTQAAISGRRYEAPTILNLPVARAALDYFFSPPERGRVFRVVDADLDLDGQRERLVLDGKRDPALRIWRGDTLLWQGVRERWNPWKLMIADVDGDGRREIVLGVHKSTHYFPRPHNCLFIYGWDGRRAFPKWLGSSLSRPFTDFILADLDGGAEELIALEIMRDGKRCVAVYKWNGFGFTLDWQHGSWQTAGLIAVEGGRVIVTADGERIALKRV